MNQYLTGPYAGFEKWEYPIAVQGGSYQGGLYAVPMSLNSWALYYNKSLLAEFGIKRLPKTLAQFDADQAKMWTYSGKKIVTMGFYPDTDGNGFQFYTTFFGATNCINSAGKYDFESCPGAVSGDEVDRQLRQVFLRPGAGAADGSRRGGRRSDGHLDKWQVRLRAVGAMGGSAERPDLQPQRSKATLASWPSPASWADRARLARATSTSSPRAAHAAQAFEFISWLAGYNNESFVGSIDPLGGWVPAGPSVTKTAPYERWLKANSWLSGFLPEMTSKYSAAPVLTPTQAQLFTAENTATANVLQKIMTPIRRSNTSTHRRTPRARSDHPRRWGQPARCPGCPQMRARAAGGADWLRCKA